MEHCNHHENTTTHAPPLPPLPACVSCYFANFFYRTHPKRQPRRPPEHSRRSASHMTPQTAIFQAPCAPRRRAKPPLLRGPHIHAHTHTHVCMLTSSTINAVGSTQIIATTCTNFTIMPTGILRSTQACPVHHTRLCICTLYIQNTHHHHHHHHPACTRNYCGVL